MDMIQSRLNEFRGSSSLSVPEAAAVGAAAACQEAEEGSPPAPLEAGEQDALVLVATITSLPKGYVAFEHEVGSSTAAAAAASAASTTSSEEDTHIEGPPSPDIRLHLSARSIASSTPVVSKRQVDEEIDDLAESPREETRTTGSTNGGWAASVPKQSSAGIEVSEVGTTRSPLRVRGVAASASADVPLPASPFRQIHISSPPRREQIEYEVSPEPYNIVRTIRPNENPLSVRDDVVRSLMGRIRKAEIDLGLAPRHDNQLPTPQVRWFFQPSLSAGSKTKNVSGCIDLDGYCSGVDDDCGGSDTEMEDTNTQKASDLTEPQKEQTDSEDDSAKVERWWAKGPTELKDAKPYVYRRRRGTDTTGCSNMTAEGEAEALLSDERHRLAILSRYMASLNHNNSMCGYLLKRSKRDYNVWKSVHCVLTEDCLFWVTRMKAPGETYSTKDEGGAHHHTNGHSYSAVNPTTPPRSSSVVSKRAHFSPSNVRLRAHRIGRHHMIQLSSTLLVESDPQSANPLASVPNSFEIICPSGSHHVFRVPSPSISGLSLASTAMDPRATYRNWVAAIGDRIVRCFDNDGMEHAELIGSEESAARWERTAALTVGPVLKLMNVDGAGSIVANSVAMLLHQNGWEGADVTSTSAAISQVVRLGLDVTEFRESILHSQSAILSRGREDDVIVGRIRHIAQSSAWDGAERLLFKSSCIISLIESSQKDDSAMLENILSEEEDEKYQGGNVDSLKRDILSAHRRIALFLEEQKVLRERGARGEVSGSGEEAFLIPSIDIFDEMLEKLQRLAAATEDKLRKQDERRQHGHDGGPSSLPGGLPPIVAGGAFTDNN